MDQPVAIDRSAKTRGRTVIRNGQPDLIATFDYFRFQRPQIPSALRGRAFSNPSHVSDANLLPFLGESLAAPRPGKPSQGAVNP